MTPRCQICGEFESENTSIIAGHDVCYDCVDMLVENEIERRGETRDAKDLEDGRDYHAEFRDRQIEAQLLKR